MAEHIEKNFTIDHLQLESDCGYIKTLEDVFKVIRSIPSVDAVVLPCKVGDTVYYKQVLTYQKEIVTAIGVDDKGVYICTNCGVYGEHVFGKELFFTREEAEKALEGRADNG